MAGDSKRGGTGGWARAAFYLGMMLMALAPRDAARAQDPENCLSCHRFRGLSRLDSETNELRLFFCSAEYYVHRQGAHARLACTACHERSEVRVIPHDVKTPVNCTQTCHITPAATGAALRFSHKRVAESVSRSAHASENLADLPFDPPLLRPGQSDCLYCHDQPTFGFERGIPAGFLDHTGETRCDTCHAEELPLEIKYFASHVAARMRPARPVRQLAQVCAVCHSDSEIVEQQYHGHDAVASYLHSFHGKASLLGSTETATCVDCHSSHEGDQHMMLAAERPDSSINPDRLPNTCRTVACHPGAPPEMSNAAVHLELDPAKPTPEYYVAVFFILMTATVMAIFFLLVILELINAAVRRHDPEHQHLIRLARAAQKHPEGRKLLQRMTPHERVQHWVLAISFTLLVITGMPIKFAEMEWSHVVVGLMGGLTVARAVHRIAGVVLIGVFLYHLGYLVARFFRRLASNRRAGIREPVWLTLWNFPMLLRPEDVRDFVQLFGHLLGLRKERPRFRRYNVLEKFEYWAVFWGMPVMGLSGIALWGMPWVSEWLSGRAMNFAFIIHSDEAYLAFIYIAAIHLFSVIFAPTVFPLSLGTLSGQAPVAELVEGHRAEVEEIARRIDLRVAPAERPKTQDKLKHAVGGALRRVYSAGLMVVYAGMAFVSLRFLILMLAAHQTAPVEIVEIPARLDPETFFARTAAPVQYQQGWERRTRGPLAHFHQVPQWFQPDPKDSCTTSGCHTPLPHGNRIEVRAFLNMHATFVDCGVCHAEGAHTPDQAGWFSLPERVRTGPPPILRLATRLEALGEIAPEDAADVSRELQALVGLALPASGDNPQLGSWLLRLETTHPRSEIWNDIISDMREGIALHVRGEYSAKIGLYAGADLVGTPNADQRTAAREYVRRQESLGAAEAQGLLDRVHANVAPVGAMCTPCHADDPTLVDVRSLGYPQARVDTLRNSPIMRSVLSIESGQPFYLPLEQDRPAEPPAEEP